MRGNLARRLRYGLHYMYSDDNVFEDNRFEDGAAGAALMYSKRLTFRRNRFLHNRGFASVGLLLKDCEALVAEDNLIADNARGLFLEGSVGNRFRRNLMAVSDVAIVLFGSSERNVFEGNAFLANQSPLQLVGRRTDTKFDGNYWSDADEPDLDGDGDPRSPVSPHRVCSITSAATSPRPSSSRAVPPRARWVRPNGRSRCWPSPTSRIDRPLVRLPAAFRRASAPSPAPSRRRRAGLVLSASALLAGLSVLHRGRRRRDGAPI